jgi:hypothetical protein
LSDENKIKVRALMNHTHTNKKMNSNHSHSIIQSYLKENSHNKNANVSVNDNDNKTTNFNVPVPVHIPIPVPPPQIKYPLPLPSLMNTDYHLKYLPNQKENIEMWSLQIKDLQSANLSYDENKELFCLKSLYITHVRLRGKVRPFPKDSYSSFQHRYDQEYKFYQIYQQKSFHDLNTVENKNKNDQDDHDHDQYNYVNFIIRRDYEATIKVIDFEISNDKIYEISGYLVSRFYELDNRKNIWLNIFSIFPIHNVHNNFNSMCIRTMNYINEKSKFIEKNISTSQLSKFETNELSNSNSNGNDRNEFARDIVEVNENILKHSSEYLIVRSHSRPNSNVNTRRKSLIATTPSEIFAYNKKISSIKSKNKHNSSSTYRKYPNKSKFKKYQKKSSSSSSSYPY